MLFLSSSIYSLSNRVLIVVSALLHFFSVGQLIKLNILITYLGPVIVNCLQYFCPSRCVEEILKSFHGQGLWLVWCKMMAEISYEISQLGPGIGGGARILNKPYSSLTRRSGKQGIHKKQSRHTNLTTTKTHGMLIENQLTTYHNN